jgi:hypothetical protein
MSSVSPATFRLRGPMLVAGGILLFVLLCFLIRHFPTTMAVVLPTSGAIFTLFGKEPGRRGLLYAGVALMLMAAGAQVFTNMQSERKSEKSQDTQNKTVTLLEQARKENAGSSTEIQHLQHNLLSKTESNAALSRELAVAQTRTLETITGGSSFCYIQLFFEQDTHASLLVLHSGINPVSDLEIRSSDLKAFPSEHTALAAMLSPTVFRVGTLPVRDVRSIGRIQLPQGVDGAYRFEFSARNGIWSQETIVRRKANGHWASVSRIYGRHPKIVKFAELKKLENRNPVCMERDQDFPTNSEDEVLRWFGGRTLPRCADVVGFQR